jgi:hypothetical protein
VKLLFADGERGQSIARELLRQRRRQKECVIFMVFLFLSLSLPLLLEIFVFFFSHRRSIFLKKEFALSICVERSA